MLHPEYAFGRQFPRHHHTIASQGYLGPRNSAAGKFLRFLLGGRDHGSRPIEHFFAPPVVIQPLQEKISHDGHKHSNRFDHIRNLSRAAFACHCRPQQIVQTKNVRHLEILQSRPAKSVYRWIPGRSAVAKPRRQINTLNAVRTARPPKRRSLGRHRNVRRSLPRFESPIGGQYRQFVPALRQPVCQRLYLHRRSAEFVERSVRLCDAQDSHSSRRIFRNDLANTLKRNWFSTRCLPRRPISFCKSGSASSVSIAVASCTASPCCTR